MTVSPFEGNKWKETFVIWYTALDVPFTAMVV